MAPTSFPTRAEIEAAAAIIRAGGLVAFPTETVYGLGANAFDAAAVERIYAAKGRPPTSPLIVHVASIEMARSVVTEWPASADRLAARFWPGPLTLVLPKQRAIPDQVTAGLPTVGVRMPAHPVARQLLEAARVPIAAPSANKFTGLSPTEASHVREALGNNVECILDGGRTDVGIESTVLSLTGDSPRLLRPGMISLPEIEEVIGPVLPAPGAPNAGGHLSPGLHEKHYSPVTKMILTDAPPEGRGAYLWWKAEKPAAIPIRMPTDAAQYARDLYSVLHRLDAEGLDFIAIEPVPKESAWAGIQDRLTRASSGS